MADLTFTQTATERRASTGIVTGKGDAGNLKILATATIELAAIAQNSTIKFGRIASNSRIMGLSTVAWDDLGAAVAPTLDMGLGSVDANITNDPVALSNGHTISVSASSASLIGDIANYGKMAWELVSGQMTDPKGELEVYGSIVDAATDTLGTITVEVYGYQD